jgi:hypothetical protein
VIADPNSGVQRFAKRQLDRRSASVNSRYLVLYLLQPFLWIAADGLRVWLTHCRFERGASANFFQQIAKPSLISGPGCFFRRLDCR